MLGPLAGEDGLLAGAELRQGADDGDLGPAGADGQHGVAVFRIPEDGSLDGRFKLFHGYLNSAIAVTSAKALTAVAWESFAVLKHG